MKKQWAKVLRDKYRSLDNPDYSFVFDEMKKNPYQKMIDDLKLQFSLNEDTDENCDVSFGYILSNPTIGACLLRVSMIGPFAFLVTINESGFTSIPIVAEGVGDMAFLDLIGIVESHGIELLDKKTLETLVSNGRKEFKPLYQWMFVDEEAPPWSGGEGDAYSSTEEA